MPDFRLERVQNLIREIISSLIMNEEIKDPRINKYLSISHVTVSKDLTSAKVYISSFIGTDAMDTSVSALNHAAGFIQSRVGKKLKTRNTPKLTFIADHSIEEGFRVNKKIEELST